MSWPSHQFYMWLRGLAKQGKTTFGGLASGPVMRLPTSAGLRLPMHSDYDGYDLREYPPGKGMAYEVAEWNAKNEKDPNGLNAKEPGSKLDAGKVAVCRGALHYFPRAIKAIAELSQIGAKKYSWQGWKNVEDGIHRYGDAGIRHELKIEDDYTRRDPDTNVLEATAVAWNNMARLELILLEEEKKNRT